MGLFSKLTSGGLMNEIRCDEPSYLIWKWRPAGGNGKRENAIRWGSSLRVKDGEVAVFVYKHGDGTLQDFIEGPFDGIADTKNLPILADLIGLAYDSGTPFQAEIYFINLASIIQTRFAVPYFEVADPRFPDFSVPVAVRGTIGFKIKDYRQFIKLHRLAEFTLEDFLDQFEQMKSMGSMQDIMGMIPGMDASKLGNIEIDEKQVARTQAIIKSMTPKERRKPDILNASRRRRIARGSGTTIQEVNRLINQFEATRKMMRQFTGKGKKGGKKGKRRFPFGF